MKKRTGKYKKFRFSGIHILYLLIGLALGYGVSYVVTRNDCFIINGSKEIVINVNDTYVDQGVKIVEFGKDITDEVVIIVYDENDEEVVSVDTTKEGEYTIVYSVESSVKWENYKLIRKVVVGGGSNE